jgi:hypothetical protein
MLSLFLLLTFGYILLKNNGAAPVPPVLVNSVVVVLAFYFGTRHPPATTVGTAPAPIAPRPPLILRVLLFLGFAGLALWFLSRSLTTSALPPELLQIWEVLAGYLVGMAASWYMHRHVRERVQSRRLAILFRDGTAGAVLLLTALICIAYALGLTGSLAARAEQILSLVITFYFGARVIG